MTDLMTRRELAELVGRTVWTIADWERRGLIARRGVDARGAVLLDRAEVVTVAQQQDEALAEHRRSIAGIRWAGHVRQTPAEVRASAQRWRDLNRDRRLAYDRERRRRARQARQREVHAATLAKITSYAVLQMDAWRARVERQRQRRREYDRRRHRAAQARRAGGPGGGP